MKEKDLILQNAICETMLLNLHTITVIVCFGSVCIEAETACASVFLHLHSVMVTGKKLIAKVSWLC